MVILTAIYPFSLLTTLINGHPYDNLPFFLPRTIINGHLDYTHQMVLFSSIRQSTLFSTTNYLDYSSMVIHNLHIINGHLDSDLPYDNLFFLLKQLINGHLDSDLPFLSTNDTHQWSSILRQSTLFSTTNNHQWSS